MFFYDLPENYTKVSYRSLFKEDVVLSEEKIITPNNRWLKVLRIVGTISVALLIPNLAFADAGIDSIAKDLYFGTFIGIAKWIIIGKGGWDTVNKMLKEDFEGAKRAFLQYLLIFCILLGLPKGLDKVEEVFDRV